ncbi:PspC domain-containing protein [Marinilabiliaceae bacterium JC017]|nr:PspC domain-containing protein [Marinilabiliaceae bacterium JC017]
MKKTVTTNISGRVFYIDEDAYSRLKSYLEKIEHWFKNKESGQEIISDIESRIAEIFENKIDPAQGVISLEMVEEVINTMGEPEDFEGDEPKEEKTTTTALVKPRKRLYRDIDNRVFGGVCSGIGAYFNIDPVVVRIIFAILPFISFGAIVPIYIILWIALPPAITTAQKLEMRGEHITISNIEKSIQKEYEEMKKNFSKVKESKAYKKSENFFKRMSRRDRSVIIIIAVITGLALLWGGGPMSFHFANPINTFTHIGPTFSHIFFPGALPLILILLLIGILFKTIFKIILYIIAFILIGAVAFNFLSWIFGGFCLMC